MKIALFLVGMLFVSCGTIALGSRIYKLSLPLYLIGIATILAYIATSLGWHV
jgi:hypothetical protein